MTSENKNYIKGLEFTLAIFCIIMPFILRLADDWEPFKSSISAYVIMDRRHIFGMVCTMAAMLFIYNGAIRLTMKSEYSLRTKPFWKYHGYNVILGLLLFGVLLFPCNTNKTIHLVFAIAFFLGCSLSIAFFGNGRFRKQRYIIAVLSIIALVIHIIDPTIISLFWAEWIALFVIGIHFILEVFGLISLTKQAKQ